MHHNGLDLLVRDVGPDRTRLPRATEVSDRIEALLKAMPLPDQTMTASLRRAQLQGYQLSLAWTFAWGQDISEDEHAAWMATLEDLA